MKVATVAIFPTSVVNRGRFQVKIVSVLQMYLDDSGKSDNPRCRFLTLAGVLADEAVWEEWTPKWRSVLDNYSVPFAHMRELLRGGGPYQGWSDDRKESFVLDLLKTLSSPDRMSIICISVTVDLGEYRNVAVRPDVKPAEAICVDCCLSHLFAHPNFRTEKAHVFFDGSEEFQRHLNYTWSRRNHDRSSWAFHIHLWKAVESQKSCPMQAADLLAWAANRRYTGDQEGEDNWGHLMDVTFLALPHYHAIYREAELLKHPGISGWPGD